MHNRGAKDRAAYYRGSRSRTRRSALAGVAFTAAALASVFQVAQAETISGALARAYGNSPDLNAQRANTRAIDENVPKATAGYRPTATYSQSLGYQYTDTHLPGSVKAETAFPRTEQLSLSENLYNGNRTANGVSQAESQVGAAREQLRLSEITLLNNAALYYMNVLRDTAILDLDRNNVQVLGQQLKQTQDRFQVGEVTRTDVANAQSVLATGRATVFQAQSNLETSIANYRQFVGVQPRSLSPARPVESLLPPTLTQAITISMREYPSITAALQNVDVAAYAVKIAEGALLPTLGVSGSVQRSNDYQGTPYERLFGAAVTAQLTVPLYDGGLTFAAVRQAKEQLGQARLDADLARNQVRAQLVSAWGSWQSARAAIQAQDAAVRAATIALTGTREEALVGQLTTLDVLNAQQTLLNARVNLVGAQHDRVVGSYNVLAAMGRLSATTLGLRVVSYDPTVHFDQVKGKWFGVTTPDGR